MSEEIIKDNKVDTQNDKLFADLKKKADLLGVKYSVNIGFDKLKTKVDLFLEEQDDDVKTVSSKGPNKKVLTIEQDARHPLLVIVSDLDASQQNDPTIVTNIGNK